jgi:hypothetical protein
MRRGGPVDHPLPWLKYLAADDAESENVDFDGMNVESPTGEHLGSIEGFIVDSDSARPYYVVVDSGGWFRSKHFLLPIGHAQLDPDRDALIAGLTRDRIEKFPGFSLDEFERLTADDLKRLNDEICTVCSVSAVTIVTADDEPFTTAWDRDDYRLPEWWERPATKLTPEARLEYAEGGTGIGSRERARGAASESVVGHDRSAPAADPSPHFGGRAQPGDVVGIETGGERTYVGDTSEDENKRRREAEEAVRKQKR